MTKQEFKSLMNQAGFSTKLELATALGVSYQCVNNWGNTQEFPHYLKPYLQALIKANKYDLLLKDIQELL